MSDQPDSFTEKLDKGRKMESRVRANLHLGQTASAQRQFDENWEEALPTMPVRFTTSLEDVEPDSILRLLEDVPASEVMEKLGSVELHIAKKIDPRNPERAAIYYQDAAGGRRHVVGFLPDEDVEYLTSFGRARTAYNVTLREVHKLREQPRCVVEFARPEMHICSSCGKEHFDETINCAECRSKRRRLNYELDDAKEKPVTVPVAGAFQKIQEHRFNQDGELKRKGTQKK